jgi:hypothetical protein
MMLVFPIFTAVGALTLSRQPENALGWLFTFQGLIASLSSNGLRLGAPCAVRQRCRLACGPLGGIAYADHQRRLIHVRAASPVALSDRPSAVAALATTGLDDPGGSPGSGYVRCPEAWSNG